MRARSHQRMQFSTVIRSTLLFGAAKSRPLRATQSSSLRMKQSVISTSCELQGLMPSSFCTRELQSFTLRMVTCRLSRGTMVQCDEPRMVMPLTSTLVPWMPIVTGVRALAPLVVGAVEDAAAADADVRPSGHDRPLHHRAAGQVERLVARRRRSAPACGRRDRSRSRPDRPASARPSPADWRTAAAAPSCRPARC